MRTPQRAFYERAPSADRSDSDPPDSRAANKSVYPSTTHCNPVMPTLQLVAIDMRGRGRSEVTGPGTYGWRNHARDVHDIADAIGAASFAVIGQSSGAAIAMTCWSISRAVRTSVRGCPSSLR